jgi:hypothetical protein
MSVLRLAAANTNSRSSRTSGASVRVRRNIVPVAAVDRRPKPRERYAEHFREQSVTLRKAVPCPIRVRGAAEERAGKHRDASEQRLERRNGARAHATAGRAIERVFA